MSVWSNKRLAENYAVLRKTSQPGGEGGLGAASPYSPLQHCSNRIEAICSTVHDWQAACNVLSLIASNNPASTSGAQPRTHAVEFGKKAMGRFPSGSWDARPALASKDGVNDGRAGVASWVQVRRLICTIVSQGTSAFIRCGVLADRHLSVSLA